jgi:superfamily II DNA helicase RecQ
VADLLEELAEAGLLRRRLIEGSGMPGGAVLSLTEEGAEVMRGQQGQVSLAWPDSLPSAATRIPAAAGRTKRGAAVAKAGISRPEAGAADPGLAESLRRWRRARASQDGVPAYIVFSDRTLEYIAAMRPSSLEELLEVPGIGPSKGARYGDAILGAIRSHAAVAET